MTIRLTLEEARECYYSSEPICHRCGSTLAGYMDVCTAPFEPSCPGFQWHEERRESLLAAYRHYEDLQLRFGDGP